MKWKDTFVVPKGIKKLIHGHKTIQLGSCFSTHISEHLKQAGFSVCDNPFGVVFHPTAIAKQLTNAISEVKETRSLLRDDIWLSYDASSSIYAFSKTELESSVINQRIHLKQALETSDILIVTFGSVHGYVLNESGEIVANCHQQNASLFTKELSEFDGILLEWKSILSCLKNDFPQLQVVFTLSPVRYSKDGWIENNRSKARLIELCHQLEKEGAFYFPSYELVIDLLRDYRFFELDEVHPNQQAIQEVWNLFQHWFFETETQLLVKEVEKLRTMEEHKILFPESRSAKEFTEQFLLKKANLLQKYPKIIW